LLIEDYAMYPRTIVLSTHLIDEVSRILEHVMVIDKGKLIINEEADALRGRAYSVIGSASIVEAFTQGKTIIHQEQLGGLITTTVMGNTEAADLKQAASLGLEITPVTLQQLIIHLTNNKSTSKVGEAR
jgi:ABC-2 type transport system ATP-binding protein